MLRDLRTREVWREIFPLAFASWYSYDFIIDRCLETILYSSIGHTTFAARPGTATERQTNRRHHCQNRGVISPDVNFIYRRFEQEQKEEGGQPPPLDNRFRYSPLFLELISWFVWRGRIEDESSVQVR